MVMLRCWNGWLNAIFIRDNDSESMPMHTHEAMMIGRTKEQLTVIGIRERK